MITRSYPVRDDTATRRISGEGEGGATSAAIPVEVAIVYGDHEAGRRALRLIDDLSVSLADEVEFQPQLWRLSLLESAEIRAAIADDFARAPIIILAANETVVSKAVQEWLEAWVDRDEGESTAIIVLATDGAGSTDDGGQPWEAWKRPTSAGLFVTGAKRLNGSLPE